MGFAAGFTAGYSAVDSYRKNKLEKEKLKAQELKRANELALKQNEEASKIASDTKSKQIDLLEKVQMSKTEEERNNRVKVFNAYQKSRMETIDNFGANTPEAAAYLGSIDLSNMSQGVSVLLPDAKGENPTEVFLPEEAAANKDNYFIGEDNAIWENGYNGDGMKEQGASSRTQIQPITLNKDVSSSAISGEYYSINGVEGYYSKEELLEATGSGKKVKKIYKPSESKDSYKSKFYDPETNIKYTSRNQEEFEEFSRKYTRGTPPASSSSGSFKNVEYTMVDANGNRIGTKTATTFDEKLKYDNDKSLVRGTIDKPSTKQFESKAEEEEYNANAASTAIDIGKTMNKGTYDGKLSTKELVRLENAAIDRLSPAEKTSLAKDEDYQIIADEITDYSKRLNAMAKEGKLPTGMIKTAVANIGRYAPEIGKLVGMSVEDIKTNLKIQGEGANTIAEIIKIVSGLAATDKEFGRQFKANIGSFFADPSMLAAELDKTQAQINKRTKARKAKWRNKGIIQRFEPKAKLSEKEKRNESIKKRIREKIEEQNKGVQI